MSKKMYYFADGRRCISIEDSQEATTMMFYFGIVIGCIMSAMIGVLIWLAR